MPSCGTGVSGLESTVTAILMNHLTCLGLTVPSEELVLYSHRGLHVAITAVTTSHGSGGPVSADEEDTQEPHSHP